MRLFRRLVVVIVILLACVGFYTMRIRRLTALASTEVESDLDGDGKTERIALNAGLAETVSVWHSGKRLWQGVPKKWKPWKLTTADVDGDGKREIVVGVHKPTRFFPKPHNCLFVYGWDGKQAFPKWLGSSLSRPFTDFIFGNLDDDKADELVSVETTRDGKRCAAVYSWNQFGFVMDWQCGAWKTVRLVEAKEGKVVVEAEGKRIVLRET
jgi:hypothetical protein